MKTKTKFKRRIKQNFGKILIIGNIALVGVFANLNLLAVEYPVDTTNLPKTLAEGQNEANLAMWPEGENEIKNYVLKAIYSAGLNPEEADCIITNESGWNDYAYNINTNGTTDFGLWMINSIHKNTISPKDRLDYKKATEWAINKRLNDGDWNAWVAWKKCKSLTLK